MTLFKRGGNKANRAASIVSKHLQGEPVEPTEPIEPVEPVQPVEPIEPKEPVEPTEPVEPIEPKEPTGPVEPKEPIEPKDIKPVVEPTKPELTDDVVFSYLSEKLNREIKSADDLTPKEKEMDPEVKQLLDWKEETGLSLSKWSDYTKDYSQLGDLDVAKEILAKKNPNFTKEELAFKLEEFVYDEDIDDDTDKIKKSIALKEFAREGRTTLEKNKLTLKEAEKSSSLTKEQAELIVFAQNVKKDVEASTKTQTDYVNKINESAVALEGLNLKLSDDIEIKYNIPKGDKKSLVKNVLEMPHWYNEDGSMKHDVVLEDGLKVTHFNSIMNEVFKQGIAVGQEGGISQNKPAGAPKIPQRDGGGAKTSNIKDVVSNITGGKSKLRFGKKK